MKHNKAIPAKLVFHIYNKQHSHLSTAIVQLVTGAFFFYMQFCEYSTTPKGGNKITCIIQKGGIRFYRKQLELLNSIGFIHLTYKVSSTFRTKKNGVKTPQ